MPELTGAVHGAPCWVSLMTHDLDSAQRFYTRVLGWEYRPGFRAEEGYCVATADGEPVAGLGMTPGTRSFVASWSVYFGVEDANRMADRIRERGGTVAVGPMQFGTGRVAWAADQQDARFGVWQGRASPGWGAVKQSGAPARIELRTGDAFAAAMFYGSVFDWDAHDPDRVDVRFESDHVVLRVDGQRVADLEGGAVEEAPDPLVRPQWHVYFGVQTAGEVDDAAERARAAGGSVLAGPYETPAGRIADLRDPEGSLFHVAWDRE
ncbi:VOC family protein [Streptomyces sp. TRM 70351]|uniref:VOC family protein n=1 Tax=Streptomyces sp. TRM 70351 TaxID=3116552 RepID=UPI002E7B9A2D|nr:VOC family protein [Streptomyces sp. TRM 70351]MEE1928033.1 VOC family protein [Streptomyces sp. TRM 70351]